MTDFIDFTHFVTFVWRLNVIEEIIFCHLSYCWLLDWIQFLKSKKLKFLRYNIIDDLNKYGIYSDGVELHAEEEQKAP